MNEKKEKKSITIFHVQLKRKFFEKEYFSWAPEMRKIDFYFGSISAIFEHFDSKQLGIKATSLYNCNLDEKTHPFYANDKCRIRKAILITKPKKPKEEKL